MILKPLLLCLLTLTMSWTMDESKYPRLISENGNLIIRPAKNRNITLDVQYGMSYINIGDIDLIHLLTTVNKAAESIETLEISLKVDIEDKYQRFSDTMSGRQGVLQRLQRLENRRSNTTSARGPTFLLRSKVRRLFTRIKNIESALAKNECASTPCKNGGTCIDNYKRFWCICPDTWQGSDCSIDVNECDRFAATDLGCQNNAICINKDGGYECVCQPRWYGVHCTKKTMACSSSSNSETCGHGVCVDGPTNDSFSCVCDQGWTTNGLTPECKVDVNECLTANPCSQVPYVPCINVPGSFYCGSCPAGYSGTGYICGDINECLIDNGGCSSSPLVQCINTLGSRMCGPCPPGYEGDGLVCTFKGICRINNGGCHPLAACSDNPSISSTYVLCSCRSGYTGTGYGINGCVQSSGATSAPRVTELIPIHCNPNPCVHGKCIDTPDGHICQCDSGYMGRMCEMLDNPCTIQPCKNGGTCIRDITEEQGFRCECTSQYTGPRCDSTVTWCGGVMNAEEGSIVYPEVNSTSYGHNTRCAWVIKTKPDKVLNVTFTKFNLELSNDCLYDWVQIHDGRNSADHIIGRFCGNTLPHGGNIVSTTNSLYFWFRSDHTVARQGFSLHWVSIDPICGGTVETSTHGTISSPGSPGKYPPHRDCYWTITASAGKRIQVHFFTLQIESHPDCEFDFLEIRDGSLATDSLLAKYCNSSSPPPLTSPGNQLTIYFHSDAYNNDYGFQLSYSVVEGIPGCGGIYTQDNGEIIPPMLKGNYVVNMMCEYSIRLPKDTTMKVTFLSFDLEDSTSCRFDYVAIYDGSSEQDNLIGRYCGGKLPTSFISSSNNLLIIFRSDWSHTKKGFHIRYDLICHQVFTALSGMFTSPGYPKPYSINKKCTYLISVPEKKAIKLSFVDFAIEGNSYPTCNYDYLKIFDGDNENSTLMGKYCGDSSLKPSDLVSKLNYLFLEFNSDDSIAAAGFVANYTTINLKCGGVMKTPSGLIVIPDDNSTDHFQYNNNMKCLWVISAPAGFRIQLTWLSFDLEKLHNCKGDYLEIYDNNTLTKESDSLGKYCGNTPPPSITSLTNMLTIKFVSDSSHSGHGFSLAYTQSDVRRVCDGNYMTSSGTITSPGWPESYPARKDCVWTIRVRNGQQIMLNFTTFDMEKYEGCAADYLEIRNGGLATAPLIGKFCGSNIPTTIPSMTNSMYLHFHSDPSRVAGGFHLTWDSTTTGCGGVLTSSKGSILSPNYPQPYGHNMECYWKISTSVGSQIQIVFAALDLEKYCNFDYVEIFDSVDKEVKSLGRFCSMNSGSASALSSSNHLFVKFRSDYYNAGSGFVINYHSVCNRNVTGYNGAIESHNFPGKYPDLNDCVWRIVVPKGNKINVTFSHFELETVIRQFSIANTSQHLNRFWGLYSSNIRKKLMGVDCFFDYVEMKDGTEKVYDSKYRYCGRTIPPKYQSKDNQVFIHFHTDKFLEYSGFRLEWSLNGCGAMMRSPVGELSTPGYPNSYPRDTECTWTIEVEVGQSIQLDVKDISLEYSENCSADSLTLYNGQDALSPLITRVCHEHKSNAVFTSSGNYMHVHFISDKQYSGRGFRALYNAIASPCGGKFSSSYGKIQTPNYPLNYFPNANCYWQISVLENHRASITFDDFDLVKVQNNCTDFVRIYEGNKPDESNLISTQLCGNNLEKTTYVSSTNEMIVEMVSTSKTGAKGFQATYSLSCGSTITAKTDGIIKVDEDLMAVQRSNSCSWTIIGAEPKDKIALTFTYLNFMRNSKTNGIQCGITKIKIYDGESVTSPVIREICDNKVPPTIVSDGNAITVELQNAIGLIQQILEAQYSVLSTACGGELKSEEGRFTSPKYPSSYPPNVQCVWTLKPSPGNQVRLSISKFDVEESDNCDKDYLEIRENNGTGNILGIYCGDTVPTNVTIGNNLWIKFSGDSDGSHTGFIAEYMYVHGNELSGLSGSIASPMYPKPYTQKSTEDFFWRITVSFTSIIRLAFKELKMASYDHCDDTNNIVIYDGYDATAPVLITACGNNLPEPTESSTNVLYIQFRNSGGPIGSLFLLEWTRVTIELNDDGDLSPFGPLNTTCGRKDIIFVPIASDTTLTSPGFPGGYGVNLRCQWIFETDPTHHISFKFISMDLEDSYECIMDKIIISTTSQANPNDWTVIDSYCRSNATGMVVEGYNRLKVEFHTDLSGNNTGFEAKIYSSCGGNLTSSTGILSPSFPKLNMYNRIRPQSTCVWSITVRPGRTIKLEFLQLNGTGLDPNTCNNFLMIRNGDSNDSPILGDGKYCGNVIPSTPLQTTGNRLFVKYNSAFRYPLPISFQSFFNFKLKYSEESIVCDYRLKLTNNENSTTISSPNYPNIPNPFTECVWVIMAPVGERIKVDFVERFDLTPSSGCALEFIEIRDGGTDESERIGKFCSSTPSTQRSSNNIIYIKFLTDIPEPKNGFKAVISIDVCGGTIYGQSGSIHLPKNLPIVNQMNDIECTWRIIGPTEHSMWININKLILPKLYLPTCNESNLEVMETLPANKSDFSLSDKLCVLTSPMSFRTSTNSAKLKLFLKKQSMKHFSYQMDVSFNTSRSFCGGTLTTPEGVLNSPNYLSGGLYGQFCNWKITVPKGRRITLEIISGVGNKKDDDFNLRAVFYNDHNFISAIHTYFTNTTRPIVESSSNKMLVYYWTRASSNYLPFKAQYTSEKISVCNSDFSGTSGTIRSPTNSTGPYFCEYEYTMPDASLISTDFTLAMTFSKIAIGAKSGPICRFLSSKITVSSLRSPVIEEVCGNYTDSFIVRSNIPHTKIAINDLTGNGSYQIDFRLYACGGHISNVDSYKLEVPPGIIGSIECIWLLTPPVGSKLEVNMTGLKFTGTDCDKEYLSIRNHQLFTLPKNVICPNNMTSPNLKPAINGIWIEYHADRYYNETVLGLEFDSKSDGCGGLLKYQKSFSTPNYPSNYGENAECTWEIVADIGFRVSLYFGDRFAIETSTNCSKDFVEVFDFQEKSWISMGRFCGRELPGTFNATSNKMKILFRSDSSINGDGFKGYWKIFCGGILYAGFSPKYLNSPGHPTYTRLLNCEYKIIAPPGNFLAVDFANFSLEDGGQNNQCSYDNVTLEPYNENPNDYYFDFSSGPEVFCGKNNPGHKRFKNGVKLSFKTDKWMQRAGFTLSYNIDLCGGIINSSKQISSPNNGKSNGEYYSELNCLWNITAPPDKVVIIRFQSFVIEHSSQCIFDYIEAFDGKQPTPEFHLATLCGNLTKSLPVLKSKTNNMLLRMVSDIGSQYAGFVADVYFTLGESAGCGGTLEVNQTKSAIFENKIYQPNTDCHWLINGPPSEILHVTFNSFHVAPCENVNQTSLRRNNCTCDFMEIRDGNGPTSPLIGRYCGHTLPNNITSSWNTLWIRFVTDGTIQSAGARLTITSKLSMCGDTNLLAEEKSKNMSSPISPDGYLPRGIRCTWRFKSDMNPSINLKFLKFDLAPPSQERQCLDDRLEIERTDTSDSEDNDKLIINGEMTVLGSYWSSDSTHVYCGHMNVSSYQVLNNELTLTLMTSSTVDNKYRGFYIEYNSQATVRNYTADQGKVSIKNVDNSTTFFIETTPKRTISLYFTSVSIMFTENNYIEIRDGPRSDSVVLSKIQGSRNPLPVFSTNNILRIDIVKENQFHYLMVDAYYVTTDRGRGCGGSVHDVEGTLSSPMYPVPYRTANKCEWTIETPYETLVSVTFKVFDLGSENTCEFNYVELINHSGNVIVKYCPGDSPATRQSDNNYLKIVQSSSTNNKGSGWLLDFSSKNGHVIV
ncbi:cubilin homolog [Arctopsyche grandis]|uniref:cubilin homolog n=1 Tax=Arctopsyche grandis TaxID=121162 RepID=UPI00406D6E76